MEILNPSLTNFLEQSREESTEEENGEMIRNQSKESLEVDLE